MPGVEKDAGAGRPDGRFDVGVRENDVGRLTAELEGDSLEIAGGAPQDLPAHRGRPREGDFVDVRMINEGRTRGLAEARYDIQHAGRKTRGESQLADFQSRERCQFCRFQHHCAPASQRRCDFPHPDHQGEIPGDDRPNDAQRLADRIGQRVGSGRNDLSVDLVGPPGVVRQGVQYRRQILPLDGGHRFTGVEALELDQGVLVLPDEISQAQQGVAPVGGAHVAPFALEGLTSRDDRSIDVGGIGFRDVRDDLLVGRVQGLEITARLRRQALPADQHVDPLRGQHVGPFRGNHCSHRRPFLHMNQRTYIDGPQVRIAMG